MKNQRDLFAVVDLETTGSSVRKGNKIIQVGITMIQDDKIMQEYDFKVNPGKAIPPLIENLTGISNKDVREAPYFEDIATYVYNLLEDCTFVAHNIAFDYQFLNQAFLNAGLPEMKTKGIDTVELSKILFPTLDSYRLSDLSKLFGFHHEAVHDAAGDARATAELLLFLKKRAVQLPLVTLETICMLGNKMQRNNQEFLEDCLEEARLLKAPLSEKIVISNGIALRKKEVAFEQTDYRLKEELTEEMIWEQLKNKTGLLDRKNQMDMMTHIGHFFNNEQDALAIEAPAGMGKTYAYLIPALLSASPSKKVVISTSTLLLQEQLEHVLLGLKQSVAFSFEYASLSSKTHLLHLNKLLELESESLTHTERLVLMSIYVWLTETETGDLTELSPSHHMGTLIESLSYRSDDNEIGKKWQEDDFYAFHNEKANHASIILTNHSYLSYHFPEMASFQSEEKPFFIADEAHRLPKAFQDKERVKVPLSVIRKKIQRFAIDVRNYREHLEHNATKPFPHYELINYEFSLEQLYTNLDKLENEIALSALQTVTRSPKKLTEGEIALASEEINSARFQRLGKKILQFINEVCLTGLRYTESDTDVKDSSFHKRIFSFTYTLRQYQEAFTTFLQPGPYSYYSLFYQILDDYVTAELQKAEWDIGDKLQGNLTDYFQKKLYISASLFLEEKDDYFTRKIGTKKIESLSYPRTLRESKRHLHILVPNDIEAIQHLTQKQWSKQLVSFIAKITQVEKKKVLVLFNSNAVLEEVFKQLRTSVDFDSMGIDVLAQGFSGSRRRMHRRFLEAEQAVLLGSGMYWEGIDFPDNPVDRLVLTRLPFDAPDTPENQAIERHYRKVGKSAFQEEFLPRMLMRMVQGLGRIARQDLSSGILICLDTRFLHSSYAKQIKRVLPEGVTIEECSTEDLMKKLNKFAEE